MNKKLSLISYALVSIGSLFANPITAENGYNDCNPVSNGENRCLESQLNENTRVIFDVGANRGDWTYVALEHAPNAAVYAFEPHPKILANLQNRYEDKNVICFPLGLSNVTQTQNLWVWEQGNDVNRSGLNSLHHRPVLDKMLRKKPIEIEVSLDTLDNICKEQNIEHIDFVKIDTEGNEYFVLLGAKEMLEKDAIDTIQFEYGGCYTDSKTTLQSVYEMLTAYDYEIFRILPHSLLPITEWNENLENYQYSNYLAKKKATL